MSKNVIVTDGNYKIVVPDNNSIVLDTGTAVGTVEITGNLLVKGTQTTVNSATLEIDDNIICLLYTSPSPRDKRQSRMPSSA